MPLVTALRGPLWASCLLTSTSCSLTGVWDVKLFASEELPIHSSEQHGGGLSTYWETTAVLKIHASDNFELDITHSFEDWRYDELVHSGVQEAEVYTGDLHKEDGLYLLEWDNYPNSDLECERDRDRLLCEDQWHADYVFKRAE